MVLIIVEKSKSKNKNFENKILNSKIIYNFFFKKYQSDIL